MRHYLSVFKKKYFFKLFLSILISFLCALPVMSQQSSQAENFPESSIQGRTEMNNNVNRLDIPNIDFKITQPKSGKEVAFSVQLLVLLTILTLAPSILILVTCFLRFSIVLNFIKTALSLQQVPPASVLNGIAFFMTIFIMWPTFTTIYNNAYKPLSDGKITIEEAYTKASSPIRIFMYSQMSKDPENIEMFMSMAKLPKPKTLANVPTYVLIPSYILHELTISFKIGVILYIPFIIIDMVVASILMSMGMMMLPPVQISMPFKLMLFVLVDGWGLLTQELFNSVIH